MCSEWTCNCAWNEDFNPWYNFNQLAGILLLQHLVTLPTFHIVELKREMCESINISWGFKFFYLKDGLTHMISWLGGSLVGLPWHIFFLHFDFLHYHHCLTSSSFVNLFYTLSSCPVTPLDVVKIRLQAQAKPSNFTKGHCFLYCNGLMDHLCTCLEATSGSSQWYKRPNMQFTGPVVRASFITSV